MMDLEGDPLPQELLTAVLNRLSSRSLAVAACVCGSWRTAAIAVNANPRFFSALSFLPQLEDAMDAVLEEVLAAPFWPDFAIVFASPKFKLSQISIQARRRLPPKMPLVACNSAGILGKDMATGDHAEMLFNSEGGDLSDQNGLVIAVGRFPGLHVKSLKLHNSHSIAEVESFVAAASTVAYEGHVAESPLAVLLFGDPKAQVRTVLETLDKAYGGKATVVGGLATFVEDTDTGCLLAHPAVSTPYAEDISAVDGGKFRRKSQRLADREAAILFDKETRCDFVSLVFTEERGSSSNDTLMRRVQCQVATAGGLKGVGPIYKVVSAREIKDIFTREMCTQISCERDGALMDGFAVLENIDTEINGVGIPPNHIGVFRKRKRPNQLPHFSLHELQEADEGFLLLSGGGVKTRDSFRFYQLDTVAARQLVYETLSSVTNQINGSSGIGLNENQPWMTAPSMSSSSVAKKQVIGGLLFGCAGRGEEFFGEANVETSIFREKFCGSPLAGMFCLSEFGPPAILPGPANDSEIMKGKTIENFFSSMYVIFYT